MAWNRPNEKTVDATSSSRPADRGKVPRLYKGLIAGAIVVSLGVLCLWLFSGSGEPMRGTKRMTRGTIEDAGKNARSGGFATNGKELGNRRRQLRQSDETKSGGVQSNLNVAVSDEEPGPSQKQKYESDGIDSTDQLLGMAASLAEGQSVPPMPIPDEIDKDAFLKRLREPIKIFETDNENVVHLKENMMLMREEMAKALENGEGSISQILRDHEKLMNDNNKIRNDAIAELKAIRESGDEEGAKKYLMTINLALQQMGIREMEMPLTDREIEDSEDNEP